MLGRLARWLRLLGFDTLYYRDISDAHFFRIAKQQNRFILTRDTHFLRFKNFSDFLLIKLNDTFDQLVELIKILGLKEFGVSRCVRCNGVLLELHEKKEIRSLVPGHVYLHSSKFLRCKDCNWIYWEGSHMKRFRERVCEALHCQNGGWSDSKV